MNEHVWWYVARACGVVAWVLAAAAILWGMALSTRALGSRPRAPWLLDLHRFLGALTVFFLGGHLIALVADSYVDFGPRELFVPFASSWHPLPVAIGIVAMYLLVAIEVSSLLRRWLNKRFWRAIHLTSYAVFLLSSVHFVTAGTDAANVVVRLGILLSVSAISFFLVYAAIGPGRAASVRSSSRRAEPAQARARVRGRDAA